MISGPSRISASPSAVFMLSTVMLRVFTATAVPPSAWLRTPPMSRLPTPKLLNWRALSSSLPATGTLS